MSGFPWIKRCGVLVLSGFKLRLSFLPTVRRMEERVAAVSSLAAAAPSGWTPAVIQWVTKLHFKSLMCHLDHLITD